MLRGHSKEVNTGSPKFQNLSKDSDFTHPVQYLDRISSTQVFLSVKLLSERVHNLMDIYDE